MSSIFIISGMHLFWFVVFFVNSVMTQEPAINLVLHAQDFLCFMFEMQFYVILLLVKSSLEMVIHRISNFFHMIKENKIDTKLILPEYFANCLEDTRLLHMEIFDMMENIIKSMVNEMDTNLLPGDKYKQQRLLFNHQVQKLKFDLDALEMFPINLETLLSILITTASYLLLFSQLNLTL
ncbi:uncharacterized protein LOC112601940 [Melanaphis sacchari]|uniref:uncharacterized protein LOC112601940 n=1 Tax=Melanaphis sacchari TaxID=742174 RepID=UPI000DC14CA9|nr:uncharacterized protein LOC112601940 [Melanaphis sacchari]